MSEETEDRWKDLGFSSEEEYASLPADKKASLNEAFFKAQEAQATVNWPKAIGVGLVTLAFFGSLSYCTAHGEELQQSDFEASSAPVLQPK